MKKFTADFETSTWLEDESFVWAWAICEIGNTENLRIGNTIETFFELIKKEENPVILFHNLKFDGEFILFYLLKNGFGSSVKGSPMQTETRIAEVSVNASACSVGDSVRIVGEEAVYSNAHNGVKVPGWVKKKTLTVKQISDDGTRARLMPINSWTYMKYIQKV